MIHFIYVELQTMISCGKLSSFLKYSKTRFIFFIFFDSNEKLLKSIKKQNNFQNRAHCTCVFMFEINRILTINAF